MWKQKRLPFCLFCIFLYYVNILIMSALLLFITLTTFIGVIRLQPFSRFDFQMAQ